MTERRKPRLLIIGHARHGKDTVAEMIRDIMGLKFTSSSVFVGQEAIWPMWGQERYPNFEAMFEDRINHRALWFNLISAHNTPDKARTGRTMLERGYDMYVGMRNVEEYRACIEAGLFDEVIWVDRSQSMAPEPSDSMTLNESMASMIVNNNGDLADLKEIILTLQQVLADKGYDVGEPPPAEKTWFDMPDNAVQVLDHGFFIVREVMGTDASIAESARMSYGRGTKKINDDQGLINYLVQNHHTSPLEMGEVKVHMRLPIFVMRQLVRHRTANLNEYSGRYSEMIRLFYVPQIEQICNQDTVNKQGSAEPLHPDIANKIRKQIEEQSNAAFDEYEDLLAQKVSRETARMILPLNTYTEVVWKMDVSNLIKLLFLRDDSHAQWEIREYAKLLSETLGHFFPKTYAAYMRERGRVSLNQEQLKALITGDLEGLSKSETKVVQDLLIQYYVQGPEDL
jgi:thymidylate synthase (FAD)